MPSNRYPFIAREAWLVLFVLLGLTVLTQFLLGPVAFSIAATLVLITAYFFRDPFRVIPSQPLAIVSPVHGIVTLIEEAEEIRLHSKTIRVQIKMRFHDIYSFRSPIEAKVINQWCSAPDKNDASRHFDIHLKSDEGDDVVTAIRLNDITPRFHMYLHSGERVGQGQRCGYFYFGGVVDVFMPIQSKVQVEVGQYVESGSTVLAQIIHSEVASVIHDI